MRSYSGNGLEVGIGTGRFAIPLGITTGIEPSAAMAAIAAKSGISSFLQSQSNYHLKTITLI